MAARSERFGIIAAWPIAALLAVLSLGGLVSSAYARETPAWTAQAIGQDWFDLVIAAPWIAICGAGARRGSYRWRVLLAGAYAYTVYELFMYAFAVHFNALFLVYCTTLGLAGYALVAVAIGLSAGVEPVDRRGAHLGGAFLVAVGAAFAALWLAEDVPAVLRNRPSAELAATGLFTNPVHVVDLAFVLPAHIIAGVWLWRRSLAGALFGPIVLSFGVVMAASIASMLLVMRLPGPTIALFGLAAATATVLARVLRPIRADLARGWQRRAGLSRGV